MGLDVNFEANGKQWRLRFDMNALVRAEESLGKPVASAFPADGTMPGFLALRKLFWAGMGGKLTPDAVGDIMTEVGLTEAFRLVSEALFAAFPAAKPGEDAPGN